MSRLRAASSDDGSRDACHRRQVDDRLVDLLDRLGAIPEVGRRKHRDAAVIVVLRLGGHLQHDFDHVFLF